MESEAAAADRGAVDKAIVAVLFQGGLRRSEAAALRWADVQDAADGRGIVVYVRRSKTDQDGTAADVRYLKNGCAAALRQLRDRLTVQRSGLRPDGTAQVLGGINGQSIARRLTAAASAAGIEGRITGHSGRVGLAVELTRRGAPEQATAKGGRVEVVTDGRPLRGGRRSRAGRRRYLPVGGAGRPATAPLVLGRRREREATAERTSAALQVLKQQGRARPGGSRGRAPGALLLRDYIDDTCGPVTTGSNPRSSFAAPVVTDEQLPAITVRMITKPLESGTVQSNRDYRIVIPNGGVEMSNLPTVEDLAVEDLLPGSSPLYLDGHPIAVLARMVADSYFDSYRVSDLTAGRQGDYANFLVDSAVSVRYVWHRIYRAERPAVVRVIGASRFTRRALRSSFAPRTLFARWSGRPWYLLAGAQE